MNRRLCFACKPSYLATSSGKSGGCFGAWMRPQRTRSKRVSWAGSSGRWEIARQIPVSGPDDVLALNDASTDALSVVTYEFFDENLGSSGGQNRLADGHPSDLLLVLNPDTYPSPTALVELVKALADTEVGSSRRGRFRSSIHGSTTSRRAGRAGPAATACSFADRCSTSSVDSTTSISSCTASSRSSASGRTYISEGSPRPRCLGAELVQVSHGRSPFGAGAMYVVHSRRRPRALGKGHGFGEKGNLRAVLVGDPGVPVRAAR